MNTSNAKFMTLAVCLTSFIAPSANAKVFNNNDTSFIENKSLIPNNDLDTSIKFQTINKKRSFKDRYQKIAQSEQFKIAYKNKSIGDLIPIDN
jgi:hypothetical protein